MESRKIVMMNLFARQQWRNRHTEQTYGHERGEDRLRCVESKMETYNTTVLKRYKRIDLNNLTFIQGIHILLLFSH